MVDKDLRAFGQELRRLRTEAGLYQEELAGKLAAIHARLFPKTDLKLDGNRISKWERAFKSRAGQEWKPTRQQVLYLLEVFAGQLGPDRARNWALLAGYHLDRAEIQALFPSLPVSAGPPGPKRLDLLPEQPLFGIGRQQAELARVLAAPAEPWLVAIDGIGGIGKTTLAAALVRELQPGNRFYDVAWISAKQEDFLAGSLQRLDRPALNADSLVDALLEQLSGRPAPARPYEEKLADLGQRLQSRPYLVVIDNLETVTDYEALLPLLRRLANPTRFLLTSRHSLHAHPDVFCQSLQEMERADALAFLSHEAAVRGLAALANAGPAPLERIYQVVGGNPLALKLVVGQVHALPLSQVLQNLRQAQGRTTGELYTYIYWQAWQALDEAGRQVLLVMPLAQNGLFDQIAALTGLPADTLSQALDHLVTLSLLETGGDLDQRRYRIHRLTETFLLNEVIKWQQGQ